MQSGCVMIFPGQGSQKVGMGESFKAHPLYLEDLARANQILGFDLQALMAEGPAESLLQTDHSQLALFCVALGVYHLWRALGGPEPLAVAGHSLGEYTALVVAGVLEFESALRLVQLRGRLMQQACLAQPGAMAAVIRPDLPAIETLCAGSPVRLANINSTQQIVLSGPRAELEPLLARLRAQKLGKPVMLKVAGAFHSQLMAPAEAELTQAIRELSFQDARLPIIMNVSGQALQKGPEIQQALMAQLTSAVQWHDSLLSLSHFSRHFYELSASTLTPLVGQSLAEAQAFAISEYRQLEALLQA